MAAKKPNKQRRQRAPAPRRPVSHKPTSGQLIQSAYEITDEPLDSPYLKRVPAQVRDTLDDLHDKAQRQPNEAIPDLERLVATYPQVPLFANYLSVAYVQGGDMEKAETCVLAAYRRHPAYLFAKVNSANVCLQKGEISKIPEIFDHKLDLKLLYPRRTRFHVSECTGFAGVMCRYYGAIGERDAAVIYLSETQTTGTQASHHEACQTPLVPTGLEPMVAEMGRQARCAKRQDAGTHRDTEDGVRLMPPLVKLKDIVDELSFQSDKAFRATEEEETLDHFPDWMHDMLRTAKDILELTTISHCRPSVRKTAFRIRTKEPWRIQPHGFLLDTSANACMVAPTRKRPSD